MIWNVPWFEVYISWSNIFWHLFRISCLKLPTQSFKLWKYNLDILCFSLTNQIQSGNLYWKGKIFWKRKIMHRKRQFKKKVVHSYIHHNLLVVPKILNECAYDNNLAMANIQWPFQSKGNFQHAWKTKVYTTFRSDSTEM